MIRKRAELAGQIEHAQMTLHQLIIDLDNLDATIRLFKPDIDLEEIRPQPVPPRHSAFKGEISRLVMDTLRQSRNPLTTRDLAQHVMAGRGLNTADKRLLKLVGKRVGACLRHQRAKGTMRSRPGPGQHLLWEVVG